MNFKNGIYLTFGYKFIAGIFRLFLGAAVLYFGDLHKMIFAFFGSELAEKTSIYLFNLLTMHIRDIPRELTLLFAIFLIVYSVLEILFSVGLLYRKKLAAEGLIFILVIGIFFDIYFISKILILSRFLGVLVDIVIIVFLTNMLLRHKKSFN